jgi:hypothetical protein
VTELAVKVTARNDDGDKEVEYGYGQTTDEAVRNALDFLIANTGDDSWVQDDWEAA